MKNSYIYWTVYLSVGGRPLTRQKKIYAWARHPREAEERAVKMMTRYLSKRLSWDK